MSRKVSLKTLSEKELKKISRDLQVAQEVSRFAYNTAPRFIFLYESQGDDLYLPFAYDQSYERPERSDLVSTSTVFTGELREPQKAVRAEAIRHLNSTGSVIIAAYPGFGKTAMAINIACKIRLKTLILCHRIVLIKQWKDSLSKFSPDSKVQIVTAKSKLDESSDFYLMNAANVAKHPREFYAKIGFVIVDEAHIVMAEKLSKCMRYLLPRYVLGLTATPYRTDGLDALLDAYFGKTKIERKLVRKHTVFKIETGFKPNVELNAMGRVDWSSVIESTCINDDRNNLIVKLIKYFPERTFLVLCKRVEQANFLVKRLKEEREDVTSLIGSNQEFEQSSRILVGTVQKCGVGFDHQRLDTLVLASDVEQYFVQYLGRVFRRTEEEFQKHSVSSNSRLPAEPVIFDILDDHAILKKHFKTRNEVYSEHGGIVKDFRREFPEFFVNRLLKK